MNAATSRPVTAVVFSPTGGTLRAARMVGGLLGDVRVADAADTRTPLAFGPDDLVVAAAPVYAGQLPAVEGLFENLRGDNTPCAVVAAYGTRQYDDALAQLKARLERRGFWCAGAAACVTPHVFAPQLGAGRPDDADRAALEQFCARVLQKLASGGAPADVPGDPDPAPKRPVPVPKKRDGSLCRVCNLCAQACPVRAIVPGAIRVNPERCISCTRCAQVCPTHAIRFDTREIAARLTARCSQPRPVETFV